MTTAESGRIPSQGMPEALNRLFGKNMRFPQFRGVDKEKRPNAEPRENITPLTIDGGATHTPQTIRNSRSNGSIPQHSTRTRHIPQPIITYFEKPSPPCVDSRVSFWQSKPTMRGWQYIPLAVETHHALIALYPFSRRSTS